MADKSNKVGTNVSGAWYVDTNCINCNLCATTAPENFKTNDDEGYAYVFKQPANADELALCEEAKSSCPVEAIGNDGD
ncbi:MAG TPA: ferredoxin [Thermoanaerobaculaceae bacterium]|nr:ferredoxin [Thermoanaerobaculaceae bacterium]HRS16675.1 ferredoxin [Thermoanaerobaculaceae bacterium]